MVAGTGHGEIISILFPQDTTCINMLQELRQSMCMRHGDMDDYTSIIIHPSQLRSQILHNAAWHYHFDSIIRAVIYVE